MKVNRLKKFSLLILIPLTGCGIGGFWMNGDPSAGKNLKPYLEEWEKPGASSEMRGQASASCGGGDSDRAPLFTTAQIRAEQRPGEKEIFPTIDFMTIGSAACSKKAIDIPESATANRHRDAEHLSK
ncbi:hypothetical protein ACQUJS_08400 [Ralstonia pseudosolanacearum]